MLTDTTMTRTAVNCLIVAAVKFDSPNSSANFEMVVCYRQMMSPQYGSSNTKQYQSGGSSYG